MTNNDILRRIRYTFDFNDTKMMAIFGLADIQVTREQVSQWLKKEEDPAYQNCSDALLATFLNGLITEKRGKKDGAQPAPEKRLTNNIIFMKLKIAFNLKAEDILEIMELANFSLSKHELSAFFRKADHKNHRECKDQVLRNFLKGMQLKHRGEAEPDPIEPIEINSDSDATEPGTDKPKSGFQWKPLPRHKTDSDGNE
tara:strand:- start:97100 stop:97696 length:597 start_codon:yes stop_codon:yes gene_type:complete